jgi:hypothetical protein
MGMSTTTQSATAAQPEMPPMVEVYKASSPSGGPNSSMFQERLPNDAAERNAMHGDEEKRSMSGIEATVRHVSLSDVSSFVVNC